MKYLPPPNPEYLWENFKKKVVTPIEDFLLFLDHDENTSCSYEKCKKCLKGK